MTKLRGSAFQSGYHDFVIRRGGLVVFRRLVAAQHHGPYERTHISSGSTQLDNMLGGGLTRGTSTLLMGPAGAGKSAIAALYATAAARRGERAVIFAFDELRRTAIERADALGMNMSAEIEAGRLLVQQIDPAELSPGELAFRARELVERDGYSMIVLDSLNGYLHAMPAEKHLYVQLHELLSYFGQLGATTVMLMAQAGIIGTAVSPVDISYIADSVMLLRFFEANGHVRKAISVIKKRSGRHESTIRELTVDHTGVAVGDPLVEFRGVLTSVPEYFGTEEHLEE